MAKYHKVITEEAAEGFDRIEIEIYADCVYIKDSKSVIEISMETAKLLSYLIDKEE